MPARTLTHLGPTLLLVIVTACGSGQQSAADGPQPAPRQERNYDQLLRAAQSYLDAGKAEPAQEVAQQAAAKKPDAAAPHAILGRALAMLNQLEASAAAFEKARSLGAEDRNLMLTLASVYDVSGRYAEAIGVYRAFLAAHPEDAEMLHELGLTLVLTDQAEEGVTSLRAAQQLAPKEAQYALDLGFGLLQARQLEEAARVLQALIDADPNLGIAIQFLAQVRAAEGRNDEALALLDRAVEVGRTDPRPVRLRAQLRVVLGQFAGALADYQMLVKAEPDDAGAWIGAAGALIKLERLDEAEQAVSKARQLLGDKPQVTFRAAQIAWRRGDETAVATLEKFATDNPAVLEAWRELIVAAKKTGNKKLEKKARAKVEALQKK